MTTTNMKTTGKRIVTDANNTEWTVTRQRFRTQKKSRRVTMWFVTDDKGVVHAMENTLPEALAEIDHWAEELHRSCFECGHDYRGEIQCPRCMAASGEPVEQMIR